MGGLVVPSLEEFPQFVVIHTVKGFGVVSKAEVVVFLELSCFLVIAIPIKSSYENTDFFF